MHYMIDTFIIILIHHMAFSTQIGSLAVPQDLSFLEFFAGAGKVWKHMRIDSINSIGVDITYATMNPGEQNFFDCLSNAGFA